MGGGLKRARDAARAMRTRTKTAPSSACSFCGEHITLLGGSWTGNDGQTACTDTSAPYVPHKPQEG